jgi:sensor histidine kinase YesM
MSMTLDQSGQSFISLRQAIDYLQRYIEMEQIRNNHFTCHISVSEDLDPDETLLQPMLIQPFIENAIWHGVTARDKGININVDFEKETGQLVCTVDDDGIGIEESMKNKMNTVSLHHSVGITNIQNRIRLLNEKYDQQSIVTIIDKSNLPGQTETGTLVTLRLPLQVTEE